MKLHLNDAKVGQILDLYCMYLEQEEGLQAPVSDIVEGIVLYFLDEHPQFRVWNARHRCSGSVIKKEIVKAGTPLAGGTGPRRPNASDATGAKKPDRLKQKRQKRRCL